MGIVPWYSATVHCRAIRNLRCLAAVIREVQYILSRFPVSFVEISKGSPSRKPSTHKYQVLTINRPNGSQTA